MTHGKTLLLGALVGAGAVWGARAWLRARRRIDLAGQVVVITGGSTGLGFVLARRAAAEGAIVVVAARDSKELRAAEGELLGLGAPEALAVATDVTVREQVESLIDRVIARFGRIDVLVNNAGTIIVGPAEAMTLDDFEQAMATNFWGAVHATWAALPHMRRQGGGRVANIGSLGGKVAAPHLLPYTCSKFALSGFSEGTRAELANENILVTTVLPGLMHTGGHAHALFKGNREAEYAWFSASDVTPGLAVPVDRAAARVWDAVKVGDPEVVIGWSAKVAVALHDLSPTWFSEAMTLVDRALPSPGSGGPAVRGEDLSGRIPDALNRVVPGEARPGPSPA